MATEAARRAARKWRENHREQYNAYQRGYYTKRTHRQIETVKYLLSELATALPIEEYDRVLHNLEQM